MYFIEELICRKNLLKATGETLKKLRKRVQLRQIDLGLKSNLSKNSISLIETGQTAPTMDTIFRLCIVLEIEAVEFIEEVNKKYMKLNKKI